MQTQSTALTTGWRRPVWIALLVAASAAFSLGFACATPFVAFASIAALTMPRRDALLLIGLVWFANQAVGVGLLHYPWTADCLAWGVGLGIVSVLATFGADWAAKRFNALPGPLVWGRGVSLCLHALRRPVVCRVRDHPKRRRELYGGDCRPDFRHQRGGLSRSPPGEQATCVLRSRHRANAPIC